MSRKIVQVSYQEEKRRAYAAHRQPPLVWPTTEHVYFVSAAEYTQFVHKAQT